MVDPLTGIANRRSFLNDADDLTRRHVANPCPAAVLVIDLDQFKSINDRFGHAVGDSVLRIFAQTAKSVMRPSDLVGRLGGEEFAAVLYNINRDKAVALAEAIRNGFATAATEVDGYPVEATLSIGMVFNQTAALDMSELLAQADHSLYYAKERGRNRVEVTAFDLMGKRKDAGSPPLVAARSAA
jgi:diguanylate cyclase (GGDEF)-like protein